ncbi:GNAT family N-acetyltransferase [Ferrovibrio sp.]|jgi:GNAT superfamily N-acetyltransferase|uniref:GNAT family N-acetyltransferase n=1 Tax=Ferrovibrio sp. TaxID=1917215 RepID=UPI0035B0D427
MPVIQRIEHRMRLADRNDLPRLIEIAQATLADAAKLDFRSLQHEQTLFVAEWRTAIDGFAVFLPLQESLLVHRLAVAEDARGRGLGGWMLDVAGHHARQLGLQAVEVQRAIEERDSIAWLQRRGFSPMPHGGNRLYLRRPA